ncbi:MAG: tetratricopeptide repeat protein, partial [Sphingomonadales bacterium]|nr:tetratricopeptide repeat protein [Sphingomonadales bacterium]
YAIFQGQPVADLTPARSESQLKAALDQILQQVPVKAGNEEEQQAPDIDQLVAMGEQVLAQGEHERAVGMFAQIAQMAPDNAAVHSGLLRSLIAAGMIEEAQEALARVPQSLLEDPAIAQAKTQLELAS